MAEKSRASAWRGRHLSVLRLFLAGLLIGLVFCPSVQAESEVFLAGALLDSISDANVVPGLYGFQRRAQDLAQTINRGRTMTSVALPAPGGLITAQLGTARLSSGEQLTLDLSGDGLIHFAADAAVVRQVLGQHGRPLASLRNQGRIAADSGEVTLTARAVSDLLSSVVNNSGIRVARSLVTHTGVARLIDGDEKPGVITATKPVWPPVRILGVLADQTGDLIKLSHIGNLDAGMVRIWSDTDWWTRK